MTELRVLSPHDPVPDTGRYLVVMRRFAEDAPKATITEVIICDGQTGPVLSVPLGADRAPLAFAAAVRAARKEAERLALAVFYAVDRTAGPREREVLDHDGDHAVHLERLSDTDLADGERGTDMRDRRP